MVSKARHLIASTSIVLVWGLCCSAAVASSYQWPIPNLDGDTSLSQIQMELDGYDVSEFVTVNKDQFQFTPPAPLEARSYHLLILLFFDNGDIETLFDEPWTPANGKNSHQLTFGGLLSQQWQTDLGDQTLGEFTWTQALQSENLSAQSKGHLTADVGEIQLPFLWIAGDYRHRPSQVVTQLSGGDQSQPVNSLLFQDFARRGIAAQISQEEWRASSRWFLVQTDDQFDDWQPENQTLGSQSQWQPWDSQTLSGQLKLNFVDGKRAQGDTVYGGNGLSLQSSNYVGDERLWVHGEWAQSFFDLDGVKQGEDRQKDSAYQWGAEIRSTESFQVVSALDYWLLGHLQKQTGPAFFSVAHFSQPNDRHLNQWYLSAGHYPWHGQIQLAQEYTNVDSLSTQARQTTDQLLLTARYLKSHDQVVESQTAEWLPESLQITFTNTADQIPNDQAALAGFNLDQTIREWAMNATWRGESWLVSGQGKHWQFSDQADSLVINTVTVSEPQPDKEGWSNQLTLSMQPSKLWSWGGSQEWFSEDWSTGDVIQRQTLAAYGEWQHHQWPLRARLDTQITWQFLDNDAVLSLNRSTRSQHQLYLEWTQRRAENRQPAIKWHGQVQWHEVEDNQLPEHSSQRLLSLGVTATWPEQ